MKKQLPLPTQKLEKLGNKKITQNTNLFSPSSPTLILRQSDQPIYSPPNYHYPNASKPNHNFNLNNNFKLNLNPKFHSNLNRKMSSTHLAIFLTHHSNSNPKLKLKHNTKLTYNPKSYLKRIPSQKRFVVDQNAREKRRHLPSNEHQRKKRCWVVRGLMFSEDPIIRKNQDEPIFFPESYQVFSRGNKAWRLPKERSNLLESGGTSTKL